MASYAVEDRSVRAIPANEPEVTGDYAAHVSKTMKLEITHADDETVEFDLSGVDVSFANALRRIMLAEVPTMAIETVYVEENDGVGDDALLRDGVRLGRGPRVAVEEPAGGFGLVRVERLEEALAVVAIERAVGATTSGLDGATSRAGRRNACSPRRWVVTCRRSASGATAAVLKTRSTPCASRAAAAC